MPRGNKKKKQQKQKKKQDNQASSTRSNGDGVSSSPDRNTTNVNNYTHIKIIVKHEDGEFALYAFE